MCIIIKQLQSFFDDDHRWYVQICLYKLLVCCYIVSVCIYCFTYTNSYNVGQTYAQVRINAYLNKAKRKLQVTVISSKLAIKNVFHQKCVYMLNDFFDNRKNQYCVQVLVSSWMVRNFEINQLYFGKRCWFSGPKFPSLSQCIQSQSETSSQSKCSQIWLLTLWEMWNTMYPQYEDYQSDWWDNDKGSTPKGVFCSFWIAWFATQWSIDESSISANSSWRHRNAKFKCMFRECITSQDIHVSYIVIFVLYLIWCFLAMLIQLKMSMDIFIFYSGCLRKFTTQTMNNIQYSMREQVYLIAIRQSMWWHVVIQLQWKNYMTTFTSVIKVLCECLNVWINMIQFTCD